jgi:hypothetical protein
VYDFKLWTDLPKDKVSIYICVSNRLDEAPCKYSMISLTVVEQLLLKIICSVGLRVALTLPTFFSRLVDLQSG